MDEVEHVRTRILAGALARMGFAGGARVWWLEDPDEEVDDDVMAKASVGGNGQPLLVEAGDCLFGWRGNSQTWISAYME